MKRKTPEEAQLPGNLPAGELIKHYRVNVLKMSQPEFARSLGVSHALIGQYERGETPVSHESVLKMRERYPVLYRALAMLLLQDVKRDLGLDDEEPSASVNEAQVQTALAMLAAVEEQLEHTRRSLTRLLKDRRK